MALPFMKFAENADKTNNFNVEICGFDQFPPNATIVSVVGKARSGKSTFLNALLFSLGVAESGNVKFSEKDPSSRGGIFATGSTGQQVTRGIMAYLVDDILFLDVQGIMEGHAGFDHGLLMAAYCMSDVFIYSQQNTVTHDLFSSLIQMASFLPCVSADRKPQMILRLFDRALVSDADGLKLVKDALIDDNFVDNYKTMRSAIKQLFSQHHIVYSRPIDLSEDSDFATLKSFMKSTNKSAVTYQTMVTNTIHYIKSANSHTKDDFDRRCKEIEQSINKCDANLTSLDTLLNANIISMTNETRKITGKDNAIIKHEDSQITTTGSYDDYKSIANLIASRSVIYDEYTKKFDTVAEEVRQEPFDDLHDTLFTEIVRLRDLNETSAWDRVDLSHKITGKFGILPDHTYELPEFTKTPYIDAARDLDFCIDLAIDESYESQLDNYKDLIEKHRVRMEEIGRQIETLRQQYTNAAVSEAMEKRSEYSKLENFVNLIFNKKNKEMIDEINKLNPYYCRIEIGWNGSFYINITENPIEYHSWLHRKITIRPNYSDVQQARYNDVKMNYYQCDASVGSCFHYFLGKEIPAYIYKHYIGSDELYWFARKYYESEGITMDPVKKHEGESGNVFFDDIKFTGKYLGCEDDYARDFLKILHKSDKFTYATW